MNASSSFISHSSLFLLFKTCQQVPLIWSSTAWIVTRTDCWGSRPGTSQPLNGQIRTGPRPWASILRSASSLSRRSGPSLWAFRYLWLRQRAGSISVTSAYLSWFSRKLESTTTHPLDVNLLFLYTQQSRILSEIAPQLQTDERREESDFAQKSWYHFAYGNSWRKTTWLNQCYVTNLLAVGLFVLLPAGNPLRVAGCCVRALVLRRGRLPVLWRVLIRPLRRCEYVYKMLTTVNLAVPSDPVTSQSTKDTVPVSSFRFHAESDPGSVTQSAARRKAVCRPKSAPLLRSTTIFFLSSLFSLLAQMVAFCFVKIVACFTELVNLYLYYLYLFLEVISGIMMGKWKTFIYLH